ncbi:hypothetical protein I302_104415 [Kwoniella bestiolae CBS 10118]|uniref:Uncharacterized protein n=1 Tax=Kwoniella bestiolae CBS 10118 TaxID=1296100 RepID=A0A1B9GB76_9TREE|nr:hypothetical protein I302_03120 [Kwoniella bestiolae CBS 10118]OCF28267.1 hypothetical protein I302_03120 [Kwoniella bestiolae CBS 10118]
MSDSANPPSQSPVLYLRPFTKTCQTKSGEYTVAGTRYGIEQPLDGDVSRRPLMYKEWENSIKEAFRGGLDLSTRARRTYMEDDTRPDSSINSDLRKRIEDCWKADSGNEQPTNEIGKFRPYNEDPKNLVRYPQFFPRFGFDQLKGFIDVSEKAERKMREAIDEEKLMDIANCIVNSTKFTPVETAAFLARPALVEALQRFDKDTIPRYPWQYSMDLQPSGSSEEKDKFHVTVAITNGSAPSAFTPGPEGHDPSSPSSENERDIMTEANGETLLRHVNLGMETVCDIFSQKDETLGKPLSNEQKLERMSEALCQVMRRISSKEGMIDGHCGERHFDSETQGMTLRLPNRHNKELIRSTEEMERSMKNGDYLVSRSFVLEPSGARYDSPSCYDMWIRAQDYRQKIDDEVSNEEAKDAAHVTLARDPDFDDATIQNFMIQDVTAECEGDEGEKEDGINCQMCFFL